MDDLSLPATSFLHQNMLDIKTERKAKSQVIIIVTKTEEKTLEKNKIFFF